MSDVKTIRINELPEATTINENDIFLIEDGFTTRKITGADLLSSIKNYTDTNGNYIKSSSIGVANGIAPLNNNKKIASTYLPFGTTANTIYDGAKGKTLETSLESHLNDTDIHTSATEKENISIHISDTVVHITEDEHTNLHAHSNKFILDSITQAKINAWDAGTGNGTGTSGITSLTDLGVNASAEELNVLDGVTTTTTELNFVKGVTSDIQTQLNNKSDSSHTHTELMSPDATSYKLIIQDDGNLVIYNMSDGNYIFASKETLKMNDGSLIIPGQALVSNGVEFVGMGSANNGGYLDFHFNDSEDDYTSRIVESESGVLSMHNSLKFVPSTKVTPTISGVVSITASGQIQASSIKATSVATVGASTAYSNNQLRNTVLTTDDPGTGTESTYVNGSIICVYE